MVLQISSELHSISSQKTVILIFPILFCSHSSVCVSDDKTGILSYSIGIQNTQSSQAKASPSYHLWLLWFMWVKSKCIAICILHILIFLAFLQCNFLILLLARRARAFYEPRVATLCDICEGEDCSTACSSKPNPRSNESRSSAAARVLLNCAYLFLCVVFFQGWAS